MKDSFINIFVSHFDTIGVLLVSRHQFQRCVSVTVSSMIFVRVRRIFDENDTNTTRVAVSPPRTNASHRRYFRILHQIAIFQ
jgi:hypothetical protein